MFDNFESVKTSTPKKSIAETIKAASKYLIDRQFPEGYWNAPLDTNCCMEAQWLMAMYFIDFDDHKKERVVRYILDRQREDGSWDIYYGAEQGDINTTLECYFALRLQGFDPDNPIMSKARKWLLDNNWIDKIRVFTKYWLALFGQWPWAHTPVLPPEIFFLPKWCPFNIYDFACWARTTMMPISILTVRRPIKELPPHLQIDELFPEGRDKADFRLPRKNKKIFSMENVFLKLDHALHAYNRFPVKPFREYAIKLVLQWILEHQDEDGAWGGIQPPWIYGIIAMYVEGFALDQINMSRAIDAFNLHWRVDRGEGTMREASTRIVRTVFDYSNAPYSNMVLGEVIGFPGKWSSYPPHWHPQPEIYFYRFLPENGYGFAELSEDVVKTHHNSTVFITEKETHPQTTAPGYAMWYLWVIRHIDGDPYITPTFVPEHLWVTDPDKEKDIWPPKK